MFLTVTENVAARHRAWTGLALNIAYPIGMLYLALSASFFNNWRDLQLALTVPTLFLVVFSL